MTTIHESTALPPTAPAFRPRGGGRPLAAAIAVFLGGYLLLLALQGQLSTVAMAVVSGGDRAPSLPAGFVALLIGQFLFALAVVVVGLLLAQRPDVVTVIGILVVVIAPLLFLLLQGARLSGVLRLPLGGQAAAVVYSVLGNPWFHVVLVVGIAWLLCRPAGLGWLALLGTLVLIPIPHLLIVAGVDSSVVSLVMFPLAGLVGASILAAGKPWRVNP